MSRYDAIVVGAGAGGGVAACVLAESGKTVLLLEKGHSLDFASTGRDHLRNHRLSCYGHSTGPDIEGNPRVFEDEGGEDRVVKPHWGEYNNNASCVGGGTLVYGGQAWRFHPLDFRMASTYGVPEGSSLADWPIGYEELEPYYERAEHEIGVSGGPPAPQMPHRREYPMPPMPATCKGERLRQGAARLGWSTQAVPLLASSIPWQGRKACINCQHCVGFACPVDAKNGTQNTVIPRALRTGRCRLETEATVTTLVGDQREITGVEYVRNGARETAHAEVVIVSCGAIETARLLLRMGLGGDEVGRNLQGHIYASACSLMPEPIWDGVGPGATVSTLEFSHGNDGLIGGGMLADDFLVLPIVFAKWHRPPDVPAWGPENKRWMREAYRRFVTCMGPVQDVPSRESRVTLAYGVTDSVGLPVARLSGTTHPETIRTARFLQERAEEWLRASGAERVWGRQPSLGLSAGQHQAGTCRMGDDPAASVVDSFGKVHGTRNLFVCDASVHVTNGGFNPVLTVLALSYRTTTELLRRW